MPEKLTDAASVPYCDLADLPAEVLDVMGSVIVDHIRNLSTRADAAIREQNAEIAICTPWGNLSTYLDSALPYHRPALPSARQLRNAWESSAMVSEATDIREGRRVPKPRALRLQDGHELAIRVFRSVLGDGWEPNDDHKVAGALSDDATAERERRVATPHLIRCRKAWCRRFYSPQEHRIAYAVSPPLREPLRDGLAFFLRGVGGFHRGKHVRWFPPSPIRAEPSRAKPSRARPRCSAPGRGEPVGLIGGLCGSASWVCLWDGHVGVFGTGVRPTLLFITFF